MEQLSRENERFSLLDTFLWFASFIFVWGAMVHLSHLFSWQKDFRAFSGAWQYGTVFLLILDISAAVGLLLRKWWGVAAFLAVSSVQLIAYFFYSDVFGRPMFLVTLHVCLLSCYFFLLFSNGRHRSNN